MCNVNRSFCLPMLLSLHDLHTILDLILQFHFHVLYIFFFYGRLIITSGAIVHTILDTFQTTSSPPLVLRNSRESETRARVKITLFSRGVIFMRGCVSLALLSL